jgi:hypothetical protein
MSQNLREAEEYLNQGRQLENFHDLMMGKKSQPVKKTWELVKELEESHISDEDLKRKLDETENIRATMLVNFGENGKHTPNLCSENQSAVQMLISILGHFVKPKE